MGQTLPPTCDSSRDLPAVRRARSWRRVGLCLLAVVVGLGALGVLGVRSSSVTDRGAGAALTVTYPRVVRAGLAVPFHIEVRRAGSSDAPVQLAVSASLFERFDFQNFYPNPSAETSTRDQVLLEFDPPPGKVFRVSLDARTAPDQNGSTATYDVALLEADGRTVTAVTFRTWVVP